MDIIKEELLNVINEFDAVMDLVQPIIDNNCKSTTSSLDELMNKIYVDIITPGIETATTLQLEQAFLELSHEIYVINDKCDRMLVLDSISKINQEDKYNNSYLSPNIDKPKPTVAEITAYAENSSLMENVLHDISNKSYKICKSKIDSAQIMLNSINKILSIRMSSLNSSDIDSDKSTKIVLNENYSFA